MVSIVRERKRESEKERERERERERDCPCNILFPRLVNTTNKS